MTVIQLIDSNVPGSPLSPDTLDAILVGDVRETIKALPDQCVQSIVTSPPYFGHRIYTTDAQLQSLELGREQTYADYVSRLISIFSGMQRILKDNGTLWLNLGDTYRNNQLLGIPWRVALGLQDAGWMLRSEII